MTRGADAVVWIADGRPTEHMDYGRRVGELLVRRGWTVSHRDLRRDEIPSERASLHVLTGGATSVNERSGWMPDALARTARLLSQASRDETRVIGICLGSQMIAECLWPGSVSGGTTIEVGLHLVEWPHETTSEPVVVPAFHYEEIDPTMVEAHGGRVVAWNRHSAVQAFRAGSAIAGVQFHPELDPDDVRTLVAYHRSTIEQHGGDPAQALASVDHLEGRWSPAVFDRVLAEVGNLA